MATVSSLYADAFFELIKEKEKVAEYKNELDLIAQALDSTEGIKGFFASVKISKEEKKKVIEDSFKNEISKLSMNFLMLLVDKGRIEYYQDIIKEFHHLCNEYLQIKEGIVESVRPLTDKQIEQLEETLSKDDEKVELRNKINKTLISGFKITFENEVIDNSMKEKIRKLDVAMQRKEY